MSDNIQLSPGAGGINLAGKELDSVTTQRVLLSDPEMNTDVHISHFGALKTSSTIPVLKANFPGSSVDTGVWNETSANGGYINAGTGVASINCGVSANGSAKIATREQGIFNAGQVTVYQAGVYAGAPETGNFQKWGLMTEDEQDGLFFMNSGGDFYVCSRRNGTDNNVVSASFNGDTSFTPGASNNTYRIHYSAGRALFQRASAGKVITLHSMVDSQYPLVSDLNMGIYYENASNGGTTNHEMRIRGSSSSVFGSLPVITANGTVVDDTVMMLDKSVLAGRDPNGVYRNIDANVGGALVTADFYAEVAAGNIPNHSSVIKFGRNGDIDADGAEDVWGGGDDYTGQPTGTTVETVNIVSSSAADTIAGAGMRTVRIQGLASPTSTEYTTEDVNLSGTTTVVSTGTWWRINTAYGIDYGGNGNDVNTGDITINHTTTTANVFAIIPAENGRTRIAAWTVPSGSTAFLTSFYTTIARTNGSAGSADITLRVREHGQGGYNALKDFSMTDSAPVNAPMKFPLRIPALADVKVRASNISDNNTSVTSEMEFLVVKDTA